MGDFDEDGGADGIVGGTVGDLIAGEFGVATEVVPVGAVDNVFVAQHGVGADEFRNDVFRGDLAGGVGDRERRFGGEGDGFEFTFHRGGF